MRRAAFKYRSRKRVRRSGPISELAPLGLLALPYRRPVNLSAHCLATHDGSCSDECIFVNLVVEANGFLKSTNLELECWRVWPQRTERALRLNEAHSGRLQRGDAQSRARPMSTASETTRLVHGKFSFSRFVPKYCPILTMAVRAALPARPGA